MRVAKFSPLQLLEQGPLLQEAKPRAGQFVFLNAPASGHRRFQWHPVTIADVDCSPHNHTLVKAHMKCYGAWTQVNFPSARADASVQKQHGDYYCSQCIRFALQNARS